MVHHLYAGFLDDAVAYERTVRFWEEVVHRAERQAGQSGEWGRWIPIYGADGKTRIDIPGNPIIDGFSQRLDRAFRITQHAPLTDELEFEAWPKSYVDDRPDPSLLPAHELVIVLSLSQESATLTEHLLVEWMTQETAIDEIEATIERLIETARPPR
jgi:hypothetical protein